MTKVPLGLRLLGPTMLVASVVLSFLMVLRLLPPSLGLGFLTAALCIAGIAIGMVVTALHAGEKRRRRERDGDLP